ncbi:hypothetical protein LG634_34090 [Streptomyces bambusae]|nr:hypothetical protein [Streptomyces bambusae]MCB5169819.1 hypothetical protein [Streptomyces bambusae]
MTVRTRITLAAVAVLGLAIALLAWTKPWVSEPALDDRLPRPATAPTR